MVKYTEVLHDLLTNEVTNEAINKALSSYPMYEPVHQELYGYVPTRDELNKKILNHYRWYEIGSETVGRFLFNLEMTMNEIMPKYNQLYKSVDIMNGLDDIFGNLDVTESFEEETTGNSSASATSNSESNVNSTNETETDMTTSGRTVSSKTPQSQLQTKSIDNITSASEMGWNENTDASSSSSNDSSNSTNESTSTSEGETTGTTKHTLTRKGNQGVNTYAHDMLEFRQLFLNIEQQIINDPELASCFMLIW